MAIQAGIGIGTEKDPLQAIQSAAREARLNLSSDNFNLAIVFSSIEFAHASVLKKINSLLGPVNIVGCSSLGIICGQGIFKYGLAIMLLDIPEGIYFNSDSVKEITATQAAKAGEGLGEKLLSKFQNRPRDVAMIFSDGLIRDSSGFLFGLLERLGRSFPLVGASASDNLAFKKTYTYFNNEVASDASSGILWGGSLSFGIGTKHGWKPLGKPRYVTKATRNIVYEIDGAPAVDIYKEYFAFDLNKLRTELKLISILYPIGIYLAGEKEYLLRNILAVEDVGNLIFQGDVPEGSLIRLMIGTKDSCLAAASLAAEEAKKGMRGKNIDFVLVFDSISRYILLRRQVNKELEIIKERLGQKTPLVGMYTYGEQAPLEAMNYQGQAHFHNQSIAILAMGG